METKTAHTPPAGIYPSLTIKHNDKPTRIWSITIIGLILKIIVLIPVAIEMFFLCIAVVIVNFLINPIVCLVTGKYWRFAYELFTGFLQLNAKVITFFFGLTDKYPGFDFAIKDPALTLHFPAMPQKAPGKVYIIPILGVFVRAILLIPYYIFVSVMNYGTMVGTVIGTFPVLFSGKYPESVYEFGADMTRVHLATGVYMFGLADTYPSFWISMNHQDKKIGLIIAGAFFAFGNMMGQGYDEDRRMQRYDNGTQMYQDGTYSPGSMTPEQQQYMQMQQQYQQQQMQQQQTAPIQGGTLPPSQGNTQTVPGNQPPDYNSQ